MRNVAFESDKRKIKKLADSKKFDLFILSIIFLDAIVMGVSTYDASDGFGFKLFVLDRMFMAIFIVEMLLKLYAYGKGFFKSGWNTFDLAVVALSATAFFPYFIVLRAFRLVRALKYLSKFGRLKAIVNTFILLIPNFLAAGAALALFFYVFAIMAVNLFGDIIVEFSTLGNSLFTLLQVFTLDGWSSTIARPVMTVYPHSWIFFAAFVFMSFLIVVSCLMNVVSEIVSRKFTLKERL